MRRARLWIFYFVAAFLEMGISLNPGRAQDVQYTLRFHHYLPANSVEHNEWLIP